MNSASETSVMGEKVHEWQPRFGNARVVQPRSRFANGGRGLQTAPVCQLRVTAALTSGGSGLAEGRRDRPGFAYCKRSLKLCRGVERYMS